MTTEPKTERTKAVWIAAYGAAVVSSVLRKTPELQAVFDEKGYGEFLDRLNYEARLIARMAVDALRRDSRNFDEPF